MTISRPRTVRLRVAGLTLAVSAPDGFPLPACDPPMRRFAVSRGGDIRLALRADPPPVATHDRPLFDSGEVWRVYRHRNGYLYTFRIPGNRPPVYKAVAIDRGLREGALHFPPSAGGPAQSSALHFPLDELLFQHRLAREGAVELHACGVKTTSGVAVFCGKSGAGKTTTARLWRRSRLSATVLSDDRIVVRGIRGRWVAHGTPWHGEAGYADPGSGPLRAVCFLRHADRTTLRRLPAAEAASRLYTRTFPPLWDAQAVQAVLRTCCRLAETTPCYDLGFRPDQSAVRAAMEILA